MRQPFRWGDKEACRIFEASEIQSKLFKMDQGICRFSFKLRPHVINNITMSRMVVTVQRSCNPRLPEHESSMKSMTRKIIDKSNSCKQS